MDIDSIVNCSSVIPVIVVKDLDHAVPMAQALVKGGLKVLEVTLRTDCALEAISEIKRNVPDAVVGAGTVINKETLDLAMEAGSEFIVTPGTTRDLVDHALELDAPLLPGVCTPSEAMVLLEQGLSTLKFFPAEAAGGVAMLKSIQGPLSQLRFCPTGGISTANAAHYLALDNVACVGGSWLTPENLVTNGRWSEITELAKQASSLDQFS